MISYVGVGCIPKVSNPKSLRMNAECGMISGLRSKDVLDPLPECIFISSQISLFGHFGSLGGGMKRAWVGLLTANNVHRVGVYNFLGG